MQAHAASPKAIDFSCINTCLCKTEVLLYCMYHNTQDTFSLHCLIYELPEVHWPDYFQLLLDPLSSPAV